MKRVGLFGGSFNPVHIGHLRAAEEIKERLLLDKVVFIPASVHPFKKKGDFPNKKKRCQMLRLATRSNPDFEVSEIELQREGVSYTIDTLKHFANSDPSAQFYFIVGNENLAQIEKWNQYQDLFFYSNFAVIERPGTDTVKKHQLLPSGLKQVFTLKRAAKDTTVYEHNSLKELVFLKTSGINISSSEIRKLIMEKRSARYFVPDNVSSYILKNNLYIGE